jgi:hypothetical protein
VIGRKISFSLLLIIISHISSTARFIKRVSDSLGLGLKGCDVHEGEKRSFSNVGKTGFFEKT